MYMLMCSYYMRLECSCQITCIHLETCSQEYPKCDTCTRARLYGVLCMIFWCQVYQN
jgi:hypothetical protein